MKRTKASASSSVEGTVCFISSLQHRLFSWAGLARVRPFLATILRVGRLTLIHSKNTKERGHAGRQYCQIKVTAIVAAGCAEPESFVVPLRSSPTGEQRLVVTGIGPRTRQGAGLWPPSQTGNPADCSIVIPGLKKVDAVRPGPVH